MPIVNEYFAFEFHGTVDEVINDLGNNNDPLSILLDYTQTLNSIELLGKNYLITERIIRQGSNAKDLAVTMWIGFKNTSQYYQNPHGANCPVEFTLFAATVMQFVYTNSNTFHNNGQPAYLWTERNGQDLYLGINITNCKPKDYIPQPQQFVPSHWATPASTSTSTSSATVTSAVASMGGFSGSTNGTRRKMTSPKPKKQKK